MYKINKLEGYIIQYGDVANIYNNYNQLTFKYYESLLYTWNLCNIVNPIPQSKNFKTEKVLEVHNKTNFKNREKKVNKLEISFSYLSSPDKHKYPGGDFSVPNISDSEDMPTWGVSLQRNFGHRDNRAHRGNDA